MTLSHLWAYSEPLGVGRGGRGQTRAGSTASGRGRGTSRRIFEAEGGSQAGGSQAGDSVRDDGADSVFSQEVMEPGRSYRCLNLTQNH